VNERPPIDADALHATAGARWTRLDVVGETASTNADLLGDHDAPDRSVLLAEVQTGGRGRFDRAWVSPPRSGLTFSILLRPDAPVATWSWLPLLAGVAVHDAVAPYADAALKWPNDLLLGPDRGKAAGILAQSTGTAVVVGIGLNVSTTRDELPVPTATSLALCGATPDRTALLGEILDAFASRYDSWLGAGGDAEASGVASAYRRACATLGEHVVVELPGASVRGRASDVDASGRLVLDREGEQVVVAAGDVTHVRSV